MSRGTEEGPGDLTSSDHLEVVGRSGAPFVVEVEAGKIREFARASGTRTSLSYRLPRAHSPATYLAVAQHWREDESNPWTGIDRDLARVRHGEQEFVFFGEPPRAGDRLVATSTIVERYTKHGRRGGEMVFTTVATRFSVAGAVIAESHTTSIETEATAHGG